MTNPKSLGKTPAQNTRQRVQSRSDKRRNTEFRRQEDISVRESEKRFREAFEHAPIGMVLTDLEGRFLHVNEAFCRITGYSREELLHGDLTFCKLTHPDDIDATRIEIDRLLSNTISSFFIENRCLRGDDELLWVRISMTLRYNDNQRPYQLVGLVDDISGRKKAEEALRQSRDELEERVRERTAELENRARQLVRLTTELTTAEQRERRRLAEILHDHLQQLLVAARMQIEQLREEEAPLSESRSPLNTVYETLNEAIASTRSLTQDLSPPVLYRGGLPAALKWLARDLEQKQKLNVRIHSADAVGDLPEALNVFLFTAARELLFNVVKHAGTPEAVVRLGREGHSVVMEISDDGRGFDVSDLQSGTDSSGFGLFSIRERIEFLDGEMTADSHPGGGSRFTVRVPLVDRKEFTGSPKAATRRLGPADETVDAAADRLTEIRVLLVDDHRVMREGLMTLLQGQDGLEVIGQADNGQHAIECVERLEPDVVTMDVSMPVMDGIEATRVIKQRWPKIRIIGLSMFEESELAAKMREAGADVYLSKTGPSGQLLKAIRNEPV